MALIWMLLTKYTCQEHQDSAPIPDLDISHPMVALHQASRWQAGGNQPQASTRPVAPS